jgi:hypothetical protein
MKEYKKEQMYSHSKIYKLQCDDGHFYFGSTCNELRVRLSGHKKDSVKYPTQPVYKHINGNWDNVRIILVEEFSCEKRDELLRKENDYIQAELGNPLCLNVNKCWTGIPRDADYHRNWLAQNPNYFRNWIDNHPDYMKRWRDSHPDKVKEYRERKKVKPVENVEVEKDAVRA